MGETERIQIQIGGIERALVPPPGPADHKDEKRWESSQAQLVASMHIPTLATYTLIVDQFLA